MVAVTNKAHATPEQRLYVRARGALVGLLVVLPFVGIEFPGGPREMVWYVVFLVALGSVTFVLHLYQVRRPKRLLVAMRWMLPVDLACVMGFSYLLYGIEDAFYPVAMLLPVVFALFVRRQTAWLIGMGSALAYALGHALASPVAGANIIMFAMTVGAIPILAGIVADSTEGRRRQEEKVRVLAAERADAIKQLGRRVAELQADRKSVV